MSNTMPDSVKVTNLSTLIEDDILKKFFGFVGEIASVTTTPSQINPAVKEAVIKFDDPMAASVAVHLSGTVLADRTINVAINIAPTIPIIANAGLTSPAPATTPMFPFSPLGSAGFNNTQNGSAHALPLVNQEVVFMMESKPRQLEPIPPAVAANIHPSILQFDPAKAEEISRTIYVGNIASSVTSTQLMEFFTQAGPVAYVKMAGDGLQPTRFAFIEFADIASSQAALQMGGAILADRPLKVNHSKNVTNKPPRSAGYMPTGLGLPAVNIAPTNETEVAKQLREVQAKIVSRYASSTRDSGSPSGQKRRERSRTPSHRSRDERHRSGSRRRRHRSPERSTSRHSYHRSSRRDKSRDRRSSRRHRDDSRDRDSYPRHRSRSHDHSRHRDDYEDRYGRHRRRESGSRYRSSRDRSHGRRSELHRNRDRDSSQKRSSRRSEHDEKSTISIKGLAPEEAVEN